MPIPESELACLPRFRCGVWLSQFLVQNFGSTAAVTSALMSGVSAGALVAMSSQSSPAPPLSPSPSSSSATAESLANGTWTASDVPPSAASPSTAPVLFTVFGRDVRRGVPVLEQSREATLYLLGTSFFCSLQVS